MTQENKPMFKDNYQKNNPMHGVKLADMLSYLIEELGLEEMGARYNIRAFNNNPRFKSALKFLRTTPWARQKIEDLYLQTIQGK